MGTALVTGATSGLGEEFCWQLASAGHDLVLVARRERLLDELADRLRNVAGVRAQVLVADLADPTDLQRVCDRLDADSGTDGTGPVGLLVNNAGYGLGVPFPDDDLERELRALDVMVRAVMVLAHHAARSMRRRGRGAILNVASVASLTGAGTYSAHKAWVVAFTEGLSEELRGTGVTASCVCPGPTRTAFFDNAGVDMSRTPHWAMASPERVVGEALDAVRSRRVLVTPTPVHKAAMGAMRLSPRWVVRRVMRAIPHM
ncbi:SDR family oxidoreductase [Actinomyces sp. B33]|uniref:SDR family NAD(P)-dependent oxidoreductase n=1 Tax=Actinomyces sp. B33 TaxID=2942131 RepID=UPI002342807B|nr:SDR family oxidoreductase [Actinomyces sp. B33]MDC4232250.1 SDR family oxidoreductase [Actinomyces sp. B33]